MTVLQNTYKNFDTDRLVIRPVQLEDADFILELLNTEKFIQYIGDRHVRSIEDAEQYIRDKMLAQLERLGFGNYVVYSKADHKRIGTVGLFDREGLNAVDIGFAFLPEYEGRGYALEAAQKIMHAAFYDFNLPIVCAITTKDNYASQKLIEKLGLKYIGTTEIPNDDEELLLFELKL
ncbi:GNAT family N-acetyltransferase [Saccharicrinis sp. FJH54]|uniref:GNAT family N-acetyltransferase n=1 Tax=Saccharicrinis sp. FJH54 TaxID=3344665 RepID=UPI0035D45BEB